MTNSQPPAMIPLDDTDRAIIRALVADGRASYAKLARAVGLGHAATRMRTRRLLDLGAIEITARVDPSALGIGLFSVAFVVTDTPARAVVREIDAIEAATFVVATAGGADVLVELRCRDDRDLVESLDLIRACPGVRDLESFGLLKAFKQDYREVGGLTSSVLSLPPSAASPEAPDEVDLALIRALVADGRASYAQLARLVGLSQAAVSVRVKRLIDEGVVSIQVAPLADAVGVGGFAAVGVTFVGSVEALARQVVALPESTLVMATSGRFSLMAEIWYRDRGHLLSVLDAIRAMDGSATIEPTIYLEVEKQGLGAALR